MSDYIWPLAITGMVVAALFILRSPLIRLVDRVKRISATGIDTIPIAQNTQEKSEITSKSKSGDLLRIFSNTLVTDIYDQIMKDLDEGGFKEPGGREEFLGRALAASQLAGLFNDCYYTIYGSQLQLLQALNAHTPIGISDADVAVFFDRIAAENAEFYSNNTYDRWIGFLEHFLLIRRESGTVSITIRGREFLKYLIESGRSMGKPL